MIEDIDKNGINSSRYAHDLRTDSPWGEWRPRWSRTADIDARVKASFDDSGGTYGFPRVLDDLLDDGVRVTKKTVEASMARQDVERWIDDFYNWRRKHSNNGMNSLIDYETEHRNLESETAEAE